VRGVLCWEPGMEWGGAVRVHRVHRGQGGADREGGQEVWRGSAAAAVAALPAELPSVAAPRPAAAAVAVAAAAAAAAGAVLVVAAVVEGAADSLEQVQLLVLLLLLLLLLLLRVVLLLVPQLLKGKKGLQRLRLRLLL